METKPKVWINQKIVPWEEAKVPILSHGLSRGSAIFEAFGIHEASNGAYAFRMDMHLKRLEQTAKLLGMKLGNFVVDKVLVEEKLAIKQALSVTKGNKTRAASILKIDYSTLLRKIKQYSILP